MTGPSLAPAPYLWDMLAPSADPRDPLATINLCSALPPGVVALEVAADPGRLRLLVRAWDASAGAALMTAVYAAFPQARLGPVAADDDPAQPAAVGQHLAALELALRDPEYFPLRTYARETVEQQGDPLAVLVRAMQAVGPGERLLLRLTLAPAPAGWARRYRPLLHAARRADAQGAALPTPSGRPAGDAASGLGLLLLLGVVALGLWAWPVIAALRAGQPPVGSLGLLPWAWLAGLHPVVLGTSVGLALALLLAPLVLLARRWRRRPELPTPALLLTKLDAPGCLARVHLLAWAPDAARANASLRRVTAVLPLYARADGNALIARPTRIADPQAIPRLRVRFQRTGILSAAELSGLWGPVGGLADAGDLVRAGATRRRPPMHAPDGHPWLAAGCPLGVSEQGGVTRPVALPDELLGRVTLVLGKTGAGKSTALHHLLTHAMADPDRGVLVVDPHGDLARALLGLVPRHRQGDVIALDLADTEWPVGLNPLDVTSGRPPDRLVADTIVGLRRLWPNSWGDRMEQMLRQALITLAERNQHLPADDQFTLLHVEPLLADEHFRATVLTQLGPPVGNHDWWTGYYAGLSARLREEMINPVLTKLATFATLTAARHIIGQPRTTLDLGQAVMTGGIVIVNLARGVIGGDLAALLGALLVSAVDLAIERQAALPEAQRRQVLVAIDELQALPAIDYARLVGELRKYGAGFLLATQTLAGLDRLDPTLRPLLLGNCEALLSFRVAAEEAALLVPEFDELVAATDLTNLERGCAYLKATERGQPAPATWLRVHPPMTPEPVLATSLRTRDREAWGVPALAAAALVAAGRERMTELAEISLQAQAERRAAEAEAARRAAEATRQAANEVPTVRPPTTGPARSGLARPAEPVATDHRGGTRRGRRRNRSNGQAALPLGVGGGLDAIPALTLEGDDHDAPNGDDDDAPRARDGQP